MNTFLTRVELHNATEQHYELLHTAMANARFSRILHESNVKYQLPTAEYVCYSTTLGAQGVRDLAKRAANTTGKTSWILTVQSAGMAWELPVLH